MLSPALAPKTKTIASAKVIVPICDTECVMCSLTDCHAHRLICAIIITLPIGSTYSLPVHIFFVILNDLLRPVELWQCHSGGELYKLCGGGGTRCLRKFNLLIIKRAIVLYRVP